MSIGETPSPLRGQRPGRGLLELQVGAVPQTATIHGSRFPGAISPLQREEVRLCTDHTLQTIALFQVGWEWGKRPSGSCLRRPACVVHGAGSALHAHAMGH